MGSKGKQSEPITCGCDEERHLGPVFLEPLNLKFAGRWDAIDPSTGIEFVEKALLLLKVEPLSDAPLRQE